MPGAHRPVDTRSDLRPRHAATGSARLAGDPAVHGRGLTKHYGGVPVVNGVDLELHPGECFGLLGPNGAGKSTLIRLILGLAPRDDGELEVLGRPVPEAIRAIRARCGVVPQGDNLDIDLTVAANLRVYARYFGLRGPEVEARIDRLLAFFQLADRRESEIEALSGGMKRRLVLARALINDPELLVLDEPTTGLDPQARRLVWQQLRRLRREGRTLLLTTHYMSEAARLCDRLAVMAGGRVLALGTPEELLRRFVEPYVVEVPLDEADPPVLPETPGCRVRVTGDTAYLYTDEPGPVLERLRSTGLHPPYWRPANLEDVFLGLTGYELRED